MADRVTNEAVLVALKGLGINITGPISMTGAQNSEWKRKMLPLIRQSLGPGQYAEDIFKQAIQTAKKIKDIPVDATPEERLSQTLGAYGVKGEQLHAIMDEAIRIRKSTPGIYQAGKAFGINEYAQAAANVLGHTGAVLDAFSNAGIKQPPPPAPGTEGAKVTPPAPAPEFAGAPMAQDVPGAQRYVRADLKPAPAPKPGAKPPGTPGGPAGPTLNAEGGVVDKGLPANASDAQVEEYFRKNYGASAWMLQIPDFKDIIRQVATNPSGWSLSAVTSAVQAKPWWQANGQNVANYLQDKANLGAPEFQQKLNTKAEVIRDELIKYGINLPEDRIQQLANESYKWNWTPEQIAGAVSAEFDYTEGQKNVFVDQLRNQARSYLVPLGEETIDTWGKRLIANPEEQVNWADFLKEQAISMFPAWADRLNAGETMTAIASPYAKMAADTLELQEADIDFMDPKWMAALDQVDDKGQHTSMSYADWGRTLRMDSQYRYDYTEQAKGNAAGMATDILKKFGAIA